MLVKYKRTALPFFYQVLSVWVRIDCHFIEQAIGCWITIIQNSSIVI